VLSAVVIAVGLVFISRGLSNQLSALRAQEEYETLVSLARRALIQFEALQTVARPPTAAPLELLPRTGTFEEPYEDYQWEFSTRLMDEPAMGVGSDDPLPTQVTVAVRRNEGPSPVVRLTAIWPTDWIPATW